MLPYLDYHGSYTCWGVTNSILAQGLRRQGLPRQAADVSSRFLSNLRETGTIYEFLYVDDEGRVPFTLYEHTARSPSSEIICGTNYPEQDQAWTLSFVMREPFEVSHPLMEESRNSGRAGEQSDSASDRLTAPTLKAAYLDSGAGGKYEHNAVKSARNGDKVGYF